MMERRTRPINCSLAVPPFALPPHRVKGVLLVEGAQLFEGLQAARQRQAHRTERDRAVTTKRILITGGAGFIGCNTARYFGARNWRVSVLDNLSREGAERNLEWLRGGMAFDFERLDVRDRAAVDRVVSQSRPDAIIHLAAQVAVTTSLVDPRTDFAVNAFGTFNILDAVRRYCPDAPFIFASTNKVYGKVANAGYALQGKRYAYVSRPGGIA